MPQNSPDRWLSAYVSDQLDRCRIESCLHRYRLVFLRIKDRLQVEVALQHFTAGLMDGAYRRTKLRIGIRRNVFGNKVDEPRITLEQG